MKNLTEPHAMSLLPDDDCLRIELHNEVHARPTAEVLLPSLVTYVAVLNSDVSRFQELCHLRDLPGQSQLGMSDLEGNFLRIECGNCTLKWERHTEFTRYSIVQDLPAHAALGAREPDLSHFHGLSESWLGSIPGRTVAAIQMAMVSSELSNVDSLMRSAQTWMGENALVASQIGRGHSWCVTDFKIRADGFERILVIAPESTSAARAGRTSQRLLELETYRLMALRGLPVAKVLGPLLAAAETELAGITARMGGTETSDQTLLDTLVGLAARIERATAEHSYRFSATQAYYSLVNQRIVELREMPIPGTQTIGEFMQRRLSPAMATVAAAEKRLASLSERVSRNSALLRTRVDITTEMQNQQLLEKLTRGQEMQLRLQSTVEGLSIAAISYYVISLALYGGKALKAAGLPINPELVAGALVPLVLWSVWQTIRRIHAKLNDSH
ncbi:MAG: hypothetical protein CFE44_06730 [Burkholderiales bacterium PBB4]|nr:MAG: hypothetical protein CFE44_06730 [Burkholderiales bacterium PBB4]